MRQSIVPLQAVNRSEGESLAREYGMAFYETSAKKDIGVAEAFSTIARQVVQRLGDGGRDGKAGGAGAKGAGELRGCWGRLRWGRRPPLCLRTQPRLLTSCSRERSRALPPLLSAAGGDKVDVKKATTANEGGKSGCCK